MNEEKINQILENQKSIMSCLKYNYESEDFTYNIHKTICLLNPPEEQPTIAERTHDALSQETEVKKE